MPKTAIFDFFGLKTLFILNVVTEIGMQMDSDAFSVQLKNHVD